MICKPIRVSQNLTFAQSDVNAKLEFHINANGMI